MSRCEWTWLGGPGWRAGRGGQGGEWVELDAAEEQGGVEQMGQPNASSKHAGTAPLPLMGVGGTPPPPQFKLHWPT
jgi:hypothetical protein